MKEIEYTTENIRELCYQDNIGGIQCYIINLGKFPVAYIKLPNTHPWYGKDYNELPDFPVNGGLTYSEPILYLAHNYRIGGGWFLGWDYGHIGDYTAFAPNEEDHKYNIKEIFIDILKAVTFAMLEELKNESN